MPALDPIETVGREQEWPQEGGSQRGVFHAAIPRGDFVKAALKR